MTNRDRAESIRARHDRCGINRLEAMALLMILGMTPVNADRFLRCLPIGSDAYGNP